MPDSLCTLLLPFLTFSVSFLPRSKGDAGNSFDKNNKARFLTSERDEYQCPKTLGAWWFPENNCGNSNLNGEFQHGDGLRWSHWSKYQPGISATKVDMKIKPDCTE